MVRPMVHSQKHIVQFSIGSVTGGLVEHNTIAEAVAVANKNIPHEVEEGTTIKAVYVEMWLKAGEASNLGTYVFTIHKIPGGGSNFTFAQMAQLNDAPNKKNILFTSQGLVNTAAGSATNVIRDWVKIPKSKQRMGLGDFLMMSLSAAATIDIDRCGVALYKEYT